MLLFSVSCETVKQLKALFLTQHKVLLWLSNKEIPLEIKFGVISKNAGHFALN